MAPGNEDKKQDVCPYHSGVVQTNENFGKTISEMSGNITRLFDKFEALGDKFQAKFEALSQAFQDKLVEFAKRPGWVVCIVMAVMSSIISVMGTFILYAHFAGK